MKAVWNNVTLAESDDIVEVEGNAYFPMSALKRELVTESTTHTVCGWKGTASYFTVIVNGERNPDAVWYYPTPLPAASAVRDRVAFWRGVKIVA
ncbi:MAG: DUF427 domain-containing protein [Deltaproteobacteria bacterium]|nr:DUF427 domain-containing protein [Deltaproteobacteria bacterium]